ncbi:hypothetical protein LGN24_22135 [Burkholderia seminalis]|uniref:hypothetical protein n=1 Tax=Burkholderia cepacia complex TaxID=87882 RepID=UPI000AD96986|nr:MULTISPECIES: hypothetical protein [Burkholderia cepacia complex]MCA8304190.1 hypothetical protein [Burkholderia seminalis]
MAASPKVRVAAKPELMAAARVAADEIGMPLTEYLRRAMVHLVATRENPFAEHSGTREGRPCTHGRYSATHIANV